MASCRSCGQPVRWVRPRSGNAAVLCVPEEVVEWIDPTDYVRPEQITIYSLDGPVMTGRRVTLTARTAVEARGYLRHVCARNL